jgi:hypothetical protein
MNGLLKRALVISLCLIGTLSFAGRYAGDLSVGRVRVLGNEVMFAVSPQPPATCSSFGENMRFLLETEDDYARYSMLLTAKASGQKVDLWYNDSTSPGTDHTNGCTSSTSATLYGLGLK